MGSHCRCLTSLLGGVVGHFSGTPIHHGDKECSGRFPEQSSSGSMLQVDLGSRCGGRVTGQVAGRGRSLCHLSQLSSAVYVSPLKNPMAAGTDAFLQSWDGLQAYAFPQFSVIRQVLNKLRSCKGTLLAAPLLAYRNDFVLGLYLCDFQLFLKNYR